MGINIPPEALEAAAKAICKSMQYDWDDPSTYRHMLLEDAHAACLAMLKAWPGMRHTTELYKRTPSLEIIILPLPKENTDAEA